MAKEILGSLKLRECSPYCWVFIISFTLQLIFILSFNSFLKEPDIITHDAVVYYETAQNILHKGSAILSGEVNVRQAPFYSFYLAVIFYLFGNNIIFVQLSQALLIALTCMVILKLGSMVFNKRIGFVAAMSVAVNPVMVASSFYLLSESLLIFLLSISVFLLTNAFMREKTCLFILSGLLIGLFTLTKAVLILFQFFLVFILLFSFKFSKAIKYAVFLVIPAILVVSVWTVRNYYHTKLFIPVALGGELELWNGSYIPGEGYSDHPKLKEERHKIYEEFMQKNRISPEYLQKGGGKQYNLHYLTMQDFRRQALKNISEHPFKFMSLFPKKIYYLYIGSYSFLFGIKESFHTLLFGNNNNYISWRIPKLFFKAGLLLLSMVIFILSIVGMAKNFNNRKFIIILSIIVYWSLFFSLFSPITRYGMPVVPLLILTAVSASINLFKERKNAGQPPEIKYG